MNTPSPLVPQGAFQEKGKSHVRITVFAILAIHVVLLGVLLIAGCNKKSGADMADNTGVPPVPPASEQWPTGAQPGATPAIETPPVPLPSTGGTVAPPDAIVPPPNGGTPIPPPVPDGIIEPRPAVPGSADTTEHTIAKGELLSTIGKKYGVGYKAIIAANPGINPNRLKIGDKIRIPAKTATSPTAAAPVTGNSGGSVYVVKSGDNLLKISKATGVSVPQLRAANKLKTDQIRVGQKLKLPEHTPTAPALDSTAPPPVPAPR